MPTLVAADLQKASKFFATTRNRIVEATAGLTHAQVRFKPAVNRWSIAEILEHMVIVHERILTHYLEQLPQAPAPAPDRNAAVVDTLVQEKIPDRSIKAKAPSFIEPTGNMAPGEALAEIFSSHERLQAFLEATPYLREHILDAPPLRIVTEGAYDKMDGYQWALAAVAHDERHVRQILEVKGDPRFPV
jgi:hypothetical protein